MKIYLILINSVLLLMMGLDKLRAIHHRWRIPERVLFLLAALFGSLGGILGMLLFHHKTRNTFFVRGFSILLLLQIAALLAARHFQWI